MVDGSSFREELMDHSHSIVHLKNMKMVLEILQVNFGMDCATSTASQPRDTLTFALISSTRMALLVMWNTQISIFIPRNHIMNRPSLDFSELLQELEQDLPQKITIQIFRFNPYQVLRGGIGLTTMSVGGGTATIPETLMDLEEVGMKQPTHNGMEYLLHKLR